MTLRCFASFFGDGFAVGPVLQDEFGRTPPQAASVTFIGPLLGPLIRPVGGRPADRMGGVTVTVFTCIAMAVVLEINIGASAAKSLGLLTAGFVLTGVGNGSCRKTIPAIFRGQARVAITAGEDEAMASARARRRSGAAIGISGRRRPTRRARAWPARGSEVHRSHGRSLPMCAGRYPGVISGSSSVTDLS